MTEPDSFCVSNVKNMCRACLWVGEEVFPLIGLEMEAYQSLTQEVIEITSSAVLCFICKWMLRKCMKFSQQCRKATEILKTLQVESTSNFFLPHISSCDLKITSLGTQYLGPECLDLIPELEEDTNEYKPSEDNLEDDDEKPLVLLQDYKNKQKDSTYELTLEPGIKQELEIKVEYTGEYCNKVGKRRKKKKKVVREGFSSRMVQETDEYTVIKLSKEQVLSELAEKAKSEAYIRSPYKCDKCVKGFNFEDVLQTHMEKHTLEHGTYQCDICTQYCPSPISLRGHLKSHTTRYKCKLCGQVRLSRQHLLEHHAITHTAAPTTYTCDQCQFTTNKHTVIQRHVKTHATSERHAYHRCTVCPVEQASKRTVIQRHVKTHATSERHACHRCGKLFNTIESLRVHTMRHDKTKRLQCEQCDKHFIYPSLLHKHTQAVHERKEYYCVECDVSFKSPESLKLHFKKAKRHRDPSSYKYDCPQCPARFASRSSLAAHACAAHGAARAHACVTCARRYSSRDALRAHAWRVHTQRPPPPPPPQLGKVPRKSSRSHKDEQPYVSECDTAFTQKSSFKNLCQGSESARLP